MGVVQRHSIRHTILVYTGVIFGYVNTVILFPNILEPAEFGLTRILLSAAIIISQLAQLGTPNIVVRYFPFYRERILSKGVILCAIGIIVFSFLLLLLKPLVIDIYIEESKLFIDYFFLLFPFSIAIVYTNLFDAYLKNHFKNAFSTLLQQIFLRLLWTIIILLYSFGFIDFQSFVIAYSISYCVIAIILMIYLLKTTDVKKAFSNDKSQQVNAPSFSSFGFFTVLSGLSAFMINKIDIMMLGSYEGLAVVGIYAIASYMATIITVPASAIARTAQVLVAGAFKKADLSAVHDLYKKTSINQLILSVGIYLLILLNYQNLIYFLPDGYSDGFIVFLLLGFSKVFDNALGINGLILINSKYYKIDTYLSFLLLILTIFTNIILIPILGASGAALATLLSLALYNIMKFIFVLIKLDMTPFSSKSLLYIFVAAGTYFIVNSVPYLGNVFIDIVIRSLIIVIILLPSIYYFNISSDIKDLIDNYLKKL